jgi:2-methylcitrate dehydratase PrpD
LVNGISSHVLDFDDTTPKTFSYTTSPVAAALFGYAGASEVSGIDLLHAFILGFEVASRVRKCDFSGALRCRMAWDIEAVQASALIRAATSLR